MPKFFEEIKTTISCFNIKEYRVFGISFFFSIKNFLSKDKKGYLFGFRIYDNSKSVKLPLSEGMDAAQEYDSSNNENSPPKISIILNVPEQEKISFATLNSILKQKYSHFEIMLTGAISNESISQVTRYFSDVPSEIMVNGGRTLQSGIENSTGKFIAFCENGDCWSEDHLSEKVAIISSFQNPVVVVNDIKLVGDRRYFKYLQEIIDIRNSFINGKTMRISDDLWRKNDFILNASCCMIRKDVLHKCNFSDTTHPLLLNSWLWRQICPGNDIFYVPEKLTSVEISHEKIQKLNIDQYYMEYQLIKGDYLFAARERDQVVFPPGSENVIKTFGKIDTGKKRLAIFASFSKNSVIEDYVVYYLRELRKNVDGIVFIMDNPLLPGEIGKVQDYVFHAQCERHREYDFGSYKRGYRYLVENNILENTDELVVCNDSCYGPIFPFENVFQEMEARENRVDFWGLNSNDRIRHHIQSFFYVFKKTVFNDACFGEFLSSVKEEEDVLGVILNYEAAFTGYLKTKGHTYDTYLKYPLTGATIEKIMADKCPLIKVKMVNSISEKSEKLMNRIHNRIGKVNPVLSEILLSKLNRRK